MNMYNMVLGVSPYSEPLLLMVLQARPDLGEVNFGRIRDAWLEDHDGDVLIRVHTRNGGGNRESQAAAIESMRAHPWYVRDADDTYDETYADFYFRPSLEDLRKSLDVALGDQADSESYMHLSDEEKNGVIEDVARFFDDVKVEPVDNEKRWTEAIDKIGETVEQSDVQDNDTP